MADIIEGQLVDPEVKDKVIAAAGDILKQPTATQMVVTPPAAALLKGAEWMEGVKTLNWREVPPHFMALILANKQFPVSGGGYTKLTPLEALPIAMRCYNLGLDPNSDQVFIDPVRKTVSPTVEGLEQMARNNGINYEIVNVEYVERPWPARTPKLNDMPKDAGCKVTLSIKGKEHPLSYTAWVSEWGIRWPKVKTDSAVWMSQPWEQRTEHMLRKRAYGKTLEDLLGVGGSGAQEEGQLGKV